MKNNVRQVSRDFHSKKIILREPSQHVIVRVMAVGRFQVMAVLQAARASVLGLPFDLSLSWGLNRAIFYAAAKRGFKERVSVRPREHVLEKPITEDKSSFFLGDEMAYKTEERGKTYFTIGGKPQTVEDFKNGIETRFRGEFDVAWKEAIEIMKSFDRETLLSQHNFYEKVYHPRRDELARKWTELSI